MSTRYIHTLLILLAGSFSMQGLIAFIVNLHIKGSENMDQTFVTNAFYIILFQDSQPTQF